MAWMKRNSFLLSASNDHKIAAKFSICATEGKFKEVV